MRIPLSAALTTVCVLAGSSISAQEAPRWFGQVILGPTTRTASGPTSGIHIDGRGGILLTPHLGLIGGLSVARFSDETAVISVLCPQYAPCPAGVFSERGLGVAGATIGLQPRLRAGPLEFAITGSAGGYWLYHRGSDLPALSAGLKGGVSLGLPISSRLRVLLEGSATHLLGHSAGEASTRQLGIGAGIN